MLANRNSTVTHNPAEYAQGDRPEPSGLDRLAAALNRLADVLERAIAMGLGGEIEPRYKAAPQSEGTLVDESAMADRIGISVRTLAKYRRQGRLPKCWIRNGKRILWKVNETVTAWENGIS